MDQIDLPHFFRMSELYLGLKSVNGICSTVYVVSYIRYSVLSLCYWKKYIFDDPRRNNFCLMIT